jgi:hypothetical protein
MYLPAETLKILSLYETGMQPPMIAAEIGKTTKSVIAKLSIEGVYVKKGTLVTEKKRTKKDIVLAICDKLETDELLTLEVTSKGTLVKLERLLEAWLG